MSRYTREQINSAHLDGMKQAMDMNNSRFIVGLALKDDGTVDAVINMQDSSRQELMATIRLFVKEYYAALEQAAKDNNPG